MTNSTNNSGYNKTSIWIHWLTAILIVALFITHEGERGTAAWSFHVGGGAIAGLFFFWRILRRMNRGLAEKPEQVEVLNLLSKLVLWGLLVTIIVLTVTGYLLPWSRGQALDVYGIAIPSPIGRNMGLHEMMEEVHDFFGHLIVPLVALHILGAAKHLIFDRDKSVIRRVFVAQNDGI